MGDPVEPQPPASPAPPAPQVPLGAGRRIRYREIADALRQRLAGGELPAGALLPSEADLGAEYGASRVTVRKALELLRAEGLVDARQGYGWFVAEETFRQPLQQLGTIEQQLQRSGRESERRVLEFAFQRAPSRVRQVLGSEKVLRVVRVYLADGHPFARVTLWCPDDLGADLSRAQVEQHSFHELLPLPLAGALQTIGAGAASTVDAEVLEIPEGSPVLECERITSSVEGRPVLLAEYVFPGHRTVFTIELPHPEASPSGLRLVE